MEKYTMVKSEVQPNGDIFLFYVDENGAAEEATEGVITTTIDQSQLEQLQNDYIFEEVAVEQFSDININEQEQDVVLEDQNLLKERWLEEETKRLLIFFIDNKEVFYNGPTKKKDLWTVACKTMLTAKNPSSCEMKLRNLKKKYSQLRVNYMKLQADPKIWPFYDLCHQAFQDDQFVKTVLSENGFTEVSQFINLPTTTATDEPSGLSVKKMNKAPDEKVQEMLNLFLSYKKEASKDYSWQKQVWDKIALRIGEDGDYWHKRFLNFKQHYIRMLEKRNASGSAGVTWPYMEIFDKIFSDNTEFQNKYGSIKEHPIVTVTETSTVITEWDDTEKTVLVKYCFDCFDEFQDPTIPKGFLWNEIGRLLDRAADSCKAKYEELKSAHLNSYLEGSYSLKGRKPLAILFDSIISKEISKKLGLKQRYTNLEWTTEKIDELVNFVFDNIELFKDPICHYVCWAAIALKLQDDVKICREQWGYLTLLYKSILNDKKEDSDLQIDWRYIDLFDRIFDYGMDIKLLDGYEVRNESKSSKIAAKKVNIKMDDEITEAMSDDDDYDEKGSGKRSRGIGDPNQIKILEYYLKNKEKFGTTLRKKQALWEVLAKQMGITAEQCAHRFRNLKQVYTAYIQREINKPDKPILWPYYFLCKKVFGYRALKNKLKNGKDDSEEGEEWTPKEIKILISYFGSNFQELSSNIDDKTKWTPLAKEMNKSVKACMEKFLDLRKSYRKIKTVMFKNPESKVNWKYFKRFEEIYANEGQSMDVDGDSADDRPNLSTNAIKTEIQDDEEYQCIIVLPENEDVSSIPEVSNAQIVIKEATSQAAPKVVAKKWSLKDQLSLLTHYYNYLKANDGKIINIKDVWQDVGQHFPERTPRGCKKSYCLIKNRYKKFKEENRPRIHTSPIYRMVKKIFDLKSKFYRPPYTAEDIVLKENIVYQDIALPVYKVDAALKYYLEHVDEFVNPKYDKKYAWIDLAKSVDIPVRKIFKKVKYLMQSFNSETGEVNGVKVEFADTLKEILEKEFICKIAIGNIVEPMNTEDELESFWSDEEIQELLQFYLENLEQFKNPKYVASYLWLEASVNLNKSPLSCSNKMTDIRSQYSTMVKENPADLTDWRFYDLCQKIYGTGKRS